MPLLYPPACTLRGGTIPPHPLTMLKFGPPPFSADRFRGGFLILYSIIVLKTSKKPKMKFLFLPLLRLWCTALKTTASTRSSISKSITPARIPLSNRALLPSETLTNVVAFWLFALGAKSQTKKPFLQNNQLFYTSDYSAPSAIR